MKTLKTIKTLALSLALGTLVVFTACNESDPAPAPEPIASFSSAVDASDFYTIDFTDLSQNAESYSWDFGDGSGTSTDASPSYKFGDIDSYVVTLTVTGEDGTEDDFTETITIVDPLAAQRVLIGDNGKTWQYVADASEGDFAYQIHPTDWSQWWWTFGGTVALCERECMMDDTWTFNTDGTFTFENNGDFWQEGTIWGDEGCGDATDASNWTLNGTDMSDWDSGTHPFVYDVDNNEITVTGGFLGKMNATPSGDVTVPQASVTYDVVKLVDDVVDTLIIEVVFNNGDSPSGKAFWRSTLVSYDDPMDKIVTEECPAATKVDVTVSVDMNGYDGGFTTPAVNGTWNGWCGACNNLTDADQDGIWELTVNIDANTEFEYKFTLDGWSAQEVFQGGEECTKTTGENINRVFTTGTDAMTIPTVCWNSCSSCPN